MEGLCGRLGELLTRVQQQEKSNSQALNLVRQTADSLFKAAAEVERSWSGSNLGYHWDLYYGDFEKPPASDAFSVEWGATQGLSDAWGSRTPEEVKAQIEKRSGTTFSAAQVEFTTLLDQARALHADLVVALAPLRRAGGFDKERQLLEELEATDWREKAGNEFVATRLKSFPRMTRDSEAFAQGGRIPSHTHYAGSAVRIIRGCESIQSFWKLSERLLRQLDLQKSALRKAVSLDREPSVGVQRRYDRLVEFNLGVLATVLTTVLAGSAEVLLSRHAPPWLARDPHSLAIRALSYLTVFFLLLGLFVRRLRRWCWGGAATSALITLISLFR